LLVPCRAPNILQYHLRTVILLSPRNEMIYHTSDQGILLSRDHHSCEDICSNVKKEWGEGVPLPHSLMACEIGPNFIVQLD
jgi:hypothetical protein